MITAPRIESRLRRWLWAIAIIFGAYVLGFAALHPARAQFGPPAASATATAPIVVTPSPSNGKNFNVSCPTCGTGTGTVGSVSVATSNGLSGTVATPTTTPVITLRTPGCTGLCKSNGTALSTAAAGTDYAAPASTLAGYGITSPLPIAQGGTALSSLSGLMALQSASAVAITGGTIGGIPNPVGALDVVNQQWMDAAIGMFRSNNSVIVATTGPLPNSPVYSNGTAGFGATLTGTTNGALVIDGVTFTSTGAVLIKDQASGFQNGLYNVLIAGNAGTPWSMTRAPNYNIATNILAQAPICIAGGTVNVGQCWFQTAAVVTVGSDPLVFTRLTWKASTVVTQTSVLTPPPPCVSWDSTLAVTAGETRWILGGFGTIGRVLSRVAGGGSFTAAIQINGNPVTGCSAINVSGTSSVATTCTAANTYVDGDQISVVVSAPSGTVNTAAVCPSLSFVPQ